MSRARPLKIVVLGIMSRMPFGGLVWGTIQYLVGFDRLGHEVYYVEAHGSTPRMFIESGKGDPWAGGADYINGVLQRFDLGQRWAFHAVHDGRYFGMTESHVKELYASADLIINLHGATRPLEEHYASGKLLFLDTDPGETQIEADRHNPPMLEALGRHRAFFTWALNYGRPDCELPVTTPFDFRPTPPPIVPDFWESSGTGAGPLMTTVGNWRQDGCDVAYRGDVYRWSKHHEFAKVIDLPTRTTQPFELALSSCTDADRSLLEGHGWRVRDAIFSRDLDAYRSYIIGSRAEFTVAKDLNVRLRTGWFSERSASYLAAGRPVITQDTGFGNVLPTGEGLFPFSTIEEAVGAVDRVASDYDRHSRAARRIAREYFSYDVVLPRVLRDLGFAMSDGRTERRLASEAADERRQDRDDLRDAVIAATPPRARLIVVSKDELASLESDGRTAKHFPHEANGARGWWNPATGFSAVVQLEAARALGAEYLVLPRTALWWLDHYVEFRSHLEGRYQEIARDEATCAIWALRKRDSTPSTWTRLDDLTLDYEVATGRTPSVLDWHSGFDLSTRLPAQAVFRPPLVDAERLPYLEGTVDFVAVRATEDRKLDEARRVAAAAVLVLDGDPKGMPSLTILWRDQPALRSTPLVSIVVPITKPLPEWWGQDLLSHLPPAFNVEIVAAYSDVFDGPPLRVEGPGGFAVPVAETRVSTHNPSVLCNEGANLASSEVLAFLTPNATPLGGWIRRLKATLATRADTGVVFPKVLYPDGRLKEAGRIVSSQGAPTVLGEGQSDPELADYHYVNDVDAGSALFLGTTRTALSEAGGFESRWPNFDDAVARYCAAVRSRGLRVLYQPEIGVIDMSSVAQYGIRS